MSYRKSLLVSAFTALSLAFAEPASAGWPWSTSGWSNGPVITCFDSPEPAELFIGCSASASAEVPCPVPGTPEANGPFTGLTVKEGNPEDDNNVAFCCVQDRRGSCQPNAAAFFRREVTFSGVTANCTSNNGTGTCTYSLFYDPNVVSPQVTGQAVLDSSLNAQIPAELGPPIAKNFGCTTLEICTVNYGTISGLSNPFKQDRKNGFESGQLLGFEEFKGNDAFVGAANWKARFFRSEFNSELTTRLPLVIEGGGAAAPIEIDYRPNINDDTWSPQGNGIVPVDGFGTDEVNVTRIDFTTALINGADIIESFSFDSGSNTFRLMFRENAIPFEGTCSDGQRRFVEFKADLCIDPTVADPALCSEASRQEITGRDDVTVKTNSSGLCSELVNPSSS